MPETHCAVCGIRISDWMMASGKAEVIDNLLVHKSCVQDHHLKTGRVWSKEEVFRDLGEAR